MPRGPKGEKRPADVIGNAVHVMRIATGDAEDEIQVSGRRKSGTAGAKARSERLSPEQRKAIAQSAARKRWRKD